MASPDFRLVVRSHGASPVDNRNPGGAATCACCGLLALRGSAPWQGHAAIRVCEICNLLQTPTRPTIEREAVLIWMPELTQAQILGLAGRAHVALFAPMTTRPHDVQVAFWEHLTDALASDRTPPILPEVSLPAAQILRTLHARAGEAFRRLQSTSLRHVATAMMMADVSRKSVAENLETVLVNLRLLPLGRLYDGANDTYPELMRAYHAQHASRP